MRTTRKPELDKKAEYSPPTLKILGDVAALTRGPGGSILDGNSGMGRNMGMGMGMGMGMRT